MAKKIILSSPKEILSRVDFNDKGLKIGFKCDIQTLQRIIYDRKWQQLFVGFDQSGKKLFITEDNPKTSTFQVIDFIGAKDRLQLEEQDLRKESIKFYKHFSVKASPQFDQERFSNYKDFLSVIFKQSQGLSICDLHNSLACRFFLATHMKDLVDQGVETFFYEVPWNQKDLDAYFDPRTNVDAISLYLPSIDQFSAGMDRIRSLNGYTTSDIVKIAKKEGMKRLVAIDDIRCLSSISNESRLYTFNYFAKQIIEKEMPKGKYVIFSGGSHATTPNKYPHFPGFSQIFGIPSVVFQESSYSKILNTQGQKSYIPIQNTKEKIMFPMQVDFLVHTSPDEQSKPKLLEKE